MTPPPLRFPVLSRVRKGEKVGLPCADHGYATRPTPANGLRVATRDDVVYLTDEQLAAAGFVHMDSVKQARRMKR